MITYKTYKSASNLKKAAKLAISNRLYVSAGWLLRHELESFMKGRIEDGCISLAYDNDKPVGVCIGISEQQHFGERVCIVQAFVRSKYRRKYVGTQLVKLCRKRLSIPNARIRHYIGISGSNVFWNKATNGQGQLV